MGNWDTFLRGPSRAVMSAMAGGTCDYWPRTWVLRAFLYARDPTAQEAVIACLSDESWRVREMAAKVVARRSIGDALASIAPWQNHGGAARSCGGAASPRGVGAERSLTSK